MTNPFLILGLIIAITIHEFSHAFTADQLGDPTPRSLGRLSLNPLVHLDPLGTLMLFIAHFGWGKPIPIDPYNFKNPKRDELLVALSGPASNLVLAFVLKISLRLLPQISPFIFPIILVNISLAVFNLLPLPPLDGSKIFLNLLPVDTGANWEDDLNRFGPILLFILFFTGTLGKIIYPIINLLLSL